MSNYLNNIKKLVPNCTFLAFETVKDKLFFKAIIKNGKDTDRVRVEIKCKLEEVNQKIYDDLYDILVDKHECKKSIQHTT
jgi:hypothetical protein